MSPLLLLAEARDTLTGVVVTLLGGAALAGLVGLARWVFGSTRREGAADVTTASLAASLARMESKLDALTSGLADTREARVRIDAELAAMREANAARDARIEALEARVSRVDESHTLARHALRTEIQGWVTAGVSDALDVLRAFAGGGGGDGAARRARGGR